MTIRSATLREKLFTKRSLYQCLILGFVGGPFIWAFSGIYTLGNLVWCIGAMGVAVPLVDLLRPTYIRE